MYSKVKPIIKNGKYWYPKTKGGYSASMEAHIRKNKTRMFIGGKYIPKSHPLHKPGHYKSLSHAWSHEKIESTSEGDVYAIVNPAWEGWVKIGKASFVDDRLNTYQTSSPHRDYTILAQIHTDNRHKKELVMHRIFEDNAEARMGEWFKIPEADAVLLFLQESEEDDR